MFVLPKLASEYAVGEELGCFHPVLEARFLHVSSCVEQGTPAEPRQDPGPLVMDTESAHHGQPLCPRELTV